MVTPLGLDGAVRVLTGSGLHENKAGVDLAANAPGLENVLAEEGKRRLVDCVLDMSEELPGAGLGPSAPAADGGRPPACRGRHRNGDGDAQRRRAAERRSSSALVGVWVEADRRWRLRIRPRPRGEQQPTLLG